MKNAQLLSAVAELLKSLAETGSADGAIVVRPKSVAVIGGTVNVTFDNTINGLGLSGPLNTGDPVPSTFPTHFTGDSSDAKAENDVEKVIGRFTAGTKGDLVYDLGGTFALTKLVLYNYSELYQGRWYNNRGLTSLTVQFSTDGKTFSGDVTLRPTLIPEPAPAAIPPQVLDLPGGPFTASHVKFTNLKSGDATFTGFGQVRFTGVDAAETSGQNFVLLLASTSGGVKAKRLEVR